MVACPDNCNDAVEVSCPEAGTILMACPDVDILLWMSSCPDVGAAIKNGNACGANLLRFPFDNGSSTQVLAFDAAWSTFAMLFGSTMARSVTAWSTSSARRSFISFEWE
jgi:hypothetical protein